MAFESDADRLDMIQAVGGLCVKANQGEFFAIFDNEFIEVEGEPGVEGRQPTLTCRSTDLERLEVQKNSNLTVGPDNYRVQRAEPDGTGMTKLVLRK